MKLVQILTNEGHGKFNTMAVKFGWQLLALTREQAIFSKMSQSESSDRVAEPVKKKRKSGAPAGESDKWWVV